MEGNVTEPYFCVVLNERSSTDFPVFCLFGLSPVSFPMNWFPMCMWNIFMLVLLISPPIQYHDQPVPQSSLRIYNSTLLSAPRLWNVPFSSYHLCVSISPLLSVSALPSCWLMFPPHSNQAMQLQPTAEQRRVNEWKAISSSCNTSLQKLTSSA